MIRTDSPLGIRRNRGAIVELGEKIIREIGGKWTGRTRCEGRQTLLRVVPKEDRSLWLEKRKKSVVTDLRLLEKAIKQAVTKAGKEALTHGALKSTVKSAVKTAMKEAVNEMVQEQQEE